MSEERLAREENERDWGIDSRGYIHCDGFGCNETHPLDHEELGRLGFGTGRWMGWLYLDLNRPDLFARPMRFCSVRCCMWYLDHQAANYTPQYERAGHSRQSTKLDAALRSPEDEIARVAWLRDQTKSAFS